LLGSLKITVKIVIKLSHKTTFFGVVAPRSLAEVFRLYEVPAASIVRTMRKPPARILFQISEQSGKTEVGPDK
jgi:hypothetical protein